MSRTRFVSATVLALAAAAVPAHATYVEANPGDVCVQHKLVSACLPSLVAAGGDVLLATPTDGPSGTPHTLTPACSWQRFGAELELAAWAVAPSSVSADTTCQFTVDSRTYTTHTTSFIHGGTGWGVVKVPDGARVTACVVSSGARWADGHQVAKQGCRPN